MVTYQIQIFKLNKFDVVSFVSLFPLFLLEISSQNDFTLKDHTLSREPW